MESEHPSPRLNFGSEGDRSPLVVLLTFGTGGDLQPFLSLAAGLHDRGHRTLLVVPRYHKKRVHESGLAYVPFGTHEHSLAVLDNPDLWNERKGFGVVWRGLLPSLSFLHDLLTSHAQAGPCVVLSHPFLVPVVAMVRERQANLRLVGAYLSPSSLRTVHDPLTVGSLEIPTWVPRFQRRLLWATIDRLGIDPDLLPGLNAARVHHGLLPVRGFLEHMQSASDASVGLFPSWFARRQPDWPATFVEGDFPLQPAPTATAMPADLGDFLASGPAPIGFTAGTGHQHASGYFTNALGALQALERRGLFITTHFDQVPKSLPPEVRHVTYAPFEVLLPRLAMLVHHGGIGTTAEALRAGIPQLVLPFAFDQFDNGRRIERLRAGGVLPARKATARRLGNEIDRLLTTSAARSGNDVSSGGLDAHECQRRLMKSVELALGVSRH